MPVQSVEDYLKNGGKIKKIPMGKHGVAKTRLYTARARAKKEGWDFDLTHDWFGARMKHGRCQATGIKFGEEGTPWVASLDRIDSTRGYTQDNCWLVCWFFNLAKSDKSLKDLIHLAEEIIKNKDVLLVREKDD